MQVNEILKATNLDPGAVASLTRRLEEVLSAKNQHIKDLQYDLTKVTKAHTDAIRVYEAKMTEFGIPVEQLGFRAVVKPSSSTNAAIGMA